MTIYMSFPRIIIHNDSQVVVNTINGNIGICKDNINIMEDIRCLLTHLKDVRLEYCSRIINKNANTFTRSHIYKNYLLILFLS